MCTIVVPFATRLDEWMNSPAEIVAAWPTTALSARLYPQNAEAVLVIMECYSLDEAGEEFRGGLMFAVINRLLVSDPEHLYLSNIPSEHRSAMKAFGRDARAMFRGASQARLPPQRSFEWLRCRGIGF
jgi:hypothetical protein